METVTGIFKYYGVKTDPGGQPLYWGLAADIGMPFRGTPPALRAQELAMFVGVVADYRAGFFDVSDSNKLRDYVEILSRIEVGWYQLRAKQLFVRENTHYLEWVEQYAEIDRFRLQQRIPTGTTGQPPPVYGQAPVPGPGDFPSM